MGLATAHGCSSSVLPPKETKVGGIISPKQIDLYLRSAICVNICISVSMYNITKTFISRAGPFCSFHTQLGIIEYLRGHKKMSDSNSYSLDILHMTKIGQFMMLAVAAPIFLCAIGDLPGLSCSNRFRMMCHQNHPSGILLIDLHLQVCETWKLKMMISKFGKFHLQNFSFQGKLQGRERWTSELF